MLVTSVALFESPPVDEGTTIDCVNVGCTLVVVLVLELRFSDLPELSVVLDVVVRLKVVGTLNGIVVPDVVVVLFPVSTLFFFPAVPPTAPPTTTAIITIIATRIVILPLVDRKNGVRGVYLS